MEIFIALKYDFNVSLLVAFSHYVIKINSFKMYLYSDASSIQNQGAALESLVEVPPSNLGPWEAYQNLSRCVYVLGGSCMSTHVHRLIVLRDCEEILTNPC